jgi:uncharacterized membrane protein YfcA
LGEYGLHITNLTILTLLIIFISAFIRSTLGFGDALLSMPLLTLTIGIQSATPLVAFASFTVAATIIWGSWRQVDFKAAWRLVLSSMIGVPLGLYLLTTAPEAWVKRVLGLLLLAFGLYRLIQPRLLTLSQQRWAYLFGFVAGVLGGAYNTNGPPIVIYGTLRRWPPAHFRATLQGYFLPTILFIIISHIWSGLWTPWVMQLSGLALPVIFLAIFLGSKLNRRISLDRFDRLIYGALVSLGLLLLP